MKKTALISAALAAVIAMTGCSKTESTSGSSGSSDGNIVNDIASNVSQFIEADGRGYGKTYTAEIGEKLDNQFFSVTVNEAYKMKSVSGYYYDDYEFLVVNVTSTNIFEEDINVGAYDFNVRWAEGDDGMDYAVTDIGDDFGYDLYTDGKDIKSGETVSGNVYFAVPINQDNLMMEYVEIYDDDFNGNTYQFKLGTLEYRDDPYLAE